MTNFLSFHGLKSHFWSISICSLHDHLQHHLQMEEVHDYFKTLQTLHKLLYCRAFKTGTLLTDFYNLFVRDDIGEEIERGNDGSRHTVEISNRIAKKSYWCSFLLQGIVEALVSILMLFWYISLGIRQLNDWDNVVPCKVYDYWYECNGHAEQVTGILGGRTYDVKF